MRRDYVFGHRDMGIPEEPDKFIRWARNFVFRVKINAKRWGIPPFAAMGVELQYKEAKAKFEECGPDPPPEPHPIDGFTIYWDKKRRFEELLCGFHGLPVDKNGCFDGEELARKMLSCKGPEFLEQWKEYLMSRVRENAARYNMPPEWAESVRARLYEIKDKEPSDDGSGGMQQVFLLLCGVR